MTIKPEVLAAIESLKNDAFSWIELADECDKAQIDLQLIQSELLAMDAEIERLNHLWEMMTNLAVKKGSQIKDAESRLAAADALLRELGEWDLMNIPAATATQLDRKIETYLQSEPRP